MGRASDWSPVDMESDPTPGDPDRVEELADKLLAFADDVADAQDKLRNLMGDGLLDTFVGETADAFGEQMEGVPPNLVKLNESHELAGQALATYWPKLRQAQQDADRALADAVEAQEELSSAQSWLETAASSLETAQEAAEPPDEGEVRAEVRRALTDAENDHGDAEAAVSSAQGRLDAAKLLAQQAKEAREEAASLCVSDLRTASEAGIRNKKWWEKAVDWIADNWDTIVQVAQIIGTIVGIAALFIGGPLIAGILLAVALVALADTLVAYSKGEASLWDVGFAVLDCIPGGRLVGAGASAARTGLRDTATTIRGQRPQIRQDGRRMDSRNECGDPVDVATGELVMSATDLTLPGVLPLVLERHHISTYRSGRWFGRSWASTLDQRLRLDDYGVRFYSADGMILDYPIPLADPEHPVLPTEGPRWGLLWDGNPGSGMRVHQPETGRTLHFTPLPTRPGPELPLTAVTDRNGNRITIHYTEDGSPAEMEHSGGYRVHIATYDKRVTALHLASDPERPLLLSFGYDAHGNLSEIYNSSGLPLRFTYDDRARLIRWEDRNHTWYRYEYDAEGRVVFSTGTERALEYRYTYEPEHHRTTATNSLGHDTLYQFNDSLQLIAETDPLGNTTHRTWDRYDRPLSVIDALGGTTLLTEDGTGTSKAIVRPDGTRVHFSYNELKLLTHVRYPDGSEWRREYDDRGNCVQSTDPAGNSTSYVYDACGALRKIIDALGGTTQIENSAAGLPLLVKDPQGTATRYVRDSFGRPVSMKINDGHPTKVDWSVEGRMISRTYPSGTSEVWKWDGEGNLLSYTDGRGHETAYTYGPFDFPRERVESDGSTYTLIRDSELNLSRVEDAEGRTWEYHYDAAGRLAGERNFDGVETRYEHDELGRITRRTNGLGETVTYTYDANGYIRQKNCSDGSVTSYVRDPMGRVLRATSPGVELLRSYDETGNILSESINGRMIEFSFDALRRVVRRRTPAGHVTSWKYRKGRNPSHLVTGSHVVLFNYDEEGREVSRTVDDSVSLSQSWDDAGRLVEQSVSVGRAGKGLDVAKRRQYGYSSGNSPDFITDDSATTYYRLDEAGRIIAADGPHLERYAFDRTGRLQKASYESPSGDRISEEKAYSGTLLLRSGPCTYRYDAAGRIIQKDEILPSGETRSWHYQWGPDDRLKGTFCPNGDRWQYFYDAFGRRTEKRRTATHQEEEGIRRVEFTWDGTTIAETQEFTTAGSHRVTWDHDGNRPLFQTEEVPSDNLEGSVNEEFYSIVSDLVGKPVHLVDSQGAVTPTGDSTVWGAGIDGGNERSFPLSFPGQYVDSETTWHYNYHRHYDPATTRYTSPDPLGLLPHPDPYGYPHNPLIQSDPLGLSPHPEERRVYRAPREGNKNDELNNGLNRSRHQEGDSSAYVGEREVAQQYGGQPGYEEGYVEYRMRPEFDQEFSDKDIRMPHDGGPHEQWKIPEDRIDRFNELTIDRNWINYYGGYEW